MNDLKCITLTFCADGSVRYRVSYQCQDGRKYRDALVVCRLGDFAGFSGKGKSA